MRFFFNLSTDPAFNLALEEILTTRLGEDAFMLWRNRPAVIVGCNQNTYAEINSAVVEQKHLDVVRRPTGGGAVYHDLGNLNYSCFAAAPAQRFDAFAEFTGPVIRALAGLGVNAEFSGRNDILAGGRKISGSAKRFVAGRVLFHGTLLFDTDLGMLSRVLTPNSDKFVAKGIRSVRARVANLREFIPDMDTETFVERFTREILREFRLAAPDSIAAEFVELAESLAAEKYRSWEWNYGNNPKFDYSCQKRFPAGTVAVGLRIRGGRLDEVRFSGDFFGERSAVELAAALNGVPFRRREIAEVLGRFPIQQYLMGISADELLSLFD